MGQGARYAIAAALVLSACTMNAESDLAACRYDVDRALVALPSCLDAPAASRCRQLEQFPLLTACMDARGWERTPENVAPARVLIEPDLWRRKPRRSS